MTLLQIQYVIACAQTKSISKAAHAMFTSTSNLSRTIKSLEDELGFEVFARSANGSKLTEQGEQFLKCANMIQEQCNNIEKIKRSNLQHTFTCVSMHMNYCYMAFQKLCQLYEKDKSISFLMNTGLLSDCITSVAMHQSEIGIISIPDTIDAVERDCIAKAGLEQEFLTEQTLNVKIRKEHPALEGYRAGEPFDFTKLQDYPYISRYNQDNNVIHPIDLSHPSYFPISAINPRKRIYVDNSDWKFRLISSTNAFGIGTSESDDLLSPYHLVYIPIPGYVSRMYLIYPKGNTLSCEAVQFVEFLKEILQSHPV
ncbi:LysR family transcriptional regulator [uncultured Dysosmobacter sp.]|uniref:LysR family transcriptional regulator n=1 Tax=uncultured Dysosmobacter sp. TaxID=2591384 RepID=UPI002607BB04|nr:LysR family transcriptional regulator [uncultured Dysosmobacter sp.]